MPVHMCVLAAGPSYLSVQMFVHMSTCTCLHMSISMSIRMSTCTGALNIHMAAHMSTHMSTHRQARCAHMYTHVYTHAHTHTGSTCTCTCISFHMYTDRLYTWWYACLYAFTHTHAGSTYTWLHASLHTCPHTGGLDIHMAMYMPIHMSTHGRAVHVAARMPAHMSTNRWVRSFRRPLPHATAPQAGRRLHAHISGSIQGVIQLPALPRTPSAFGTTPLRQT